MKKLIAFLAIGLLICSSAFAVVYNWDGSDRTELLNYVFNATTGHDHDGSNSKTVTIASPYGALNGLNGVTGIANGLIFEGAVDAYEASLVVGDALADVTITIPARTGTVALQTAPVALTPGTTVTLTVGVGDQIYTDTITTDNENQTINASAAGTAGDRMTVIFTTDASGSGDEVITFGTNFLSVGTLTLANAAADVYSVSFVSTGSKWVETARTAIQAT